MLNKILVKKTLIQNVVKTSVCNFENAAFFSHISINEISAFKDVVYSGIGLSYLDCYKVQYRELNLF